MNTKNYLLMAFILLALLGIFLIFSIVNSQRTMLAFFKDEARSFLTLIALAQENSIFAEAELEDKITDNLISIIHYLNETAAEKTVLDKIRQNFNLSSILIYNPSRKSIVIKSGNPYEIDYKGFSSEDKIKYYYFTVLNEKFIRFIYNNGRLIFQIELSAEEIKKFSQEYGIGKILNQMATNPVINYVVLQDLQGIIFATPNVKTMPRIQSDSNLLKVFQNGEEVSRIINFNNKKVLEIVTPFIVEKEIIGLLRIGMNLDDYYQYLNNTYIQLGLLFIILLGAGIAIFTIFIKHQDYQMREQFFSHILGAIDEGVLLVDERGIIKGVNKMFGKITGMEETAILNAEYDKVFNQDPFSIKIVQEIKSLVEEEKEVFQKIVRYTTYPLIDSNKKFVGTISVLYDVTEIRRQEKEQKEKERLSFLGNLVANFAHEIKNPLNGLAIAAQRLQREFPLQNEQYSKLISAISKEIDSMTRILNDFLSLVRPQIKESHEFDLSQLIEEMGVLIREQAKQKNIKFNTDIEKGVVIKGNMEDLRRALMNLLLNAMEAVSAQAGLDSEIGISLKKDRDNITIKVYDNGQGIPASALKKIFEPYFTTKKGGTGLGLFIAHKIINEHNGTIDVQSSKEKGTVFTIVLPLS
uniref:histidine kinase n=1 Tax=candidate division WOR-3 bacterium TaxID=2052148 RepID=A0A7C6AGT0_UNCW3